MLAVESCGDLVNGSDTDREKLGRLCRLAVIPQNVPQGARENGHRRVRVWMNGVPRMSIGLCGGVVSFNFWFLT